MTRLTGRQRELAAAERAAREALEECRMIAAGNTTMGRLAALGHISADIQQWAEGHVSQFEDNWRKAFTAAQDAGALTHPEPPAYRRAKR